MDRAELNAASTVEKLAARHLGIAPGPRTPQDAEKGALRVDFIYEKAEPQRVALEVTSLRFSEFLAGGDAARKLEEELNRLIMQERLGIGLLP